MLRSLVLTLLLTGLFGTAQAQKFGHVNFGNVLNEMPATEAADKELETYAQQLAAQGQARLKVLQDRYKRLQVDFDNMTGKEVEAETAAIKQGQQELAQFEQESQIKVEQRRRELLAPIIERAKEAVNAVAKEGGYQMVFDSSQFNTLLFTQEGTDLTEQVIARLK